MNQFWRQGKTHKTNDGNDAAEISLSAFGSVISRIRGIQPISFQKNRTKLEKEHKGNGEKLNGRFHNCLWKSWAQRSQFLGKGRAQT